jgi:hypothetical protein
MAKIIKAETYEDYTYEYMKMISGATAQTGPWPPLRVAW